MFDLNFEKYSKLLDHLYEGPFESDPFSSFLTDIREVLDLNFTSITLREPVGNDGGLLFISCDTLEKTLIDDHSNPYTDRYYTYNLMTNLPWGKVVSLDECTSYTLLEHTEIYRICMEPVNIYHMAGLDLRNSNGQRFSVRFCRPKEAPNFTPDERHFIETLGSHIQRAVANGVQLIQLDSERKLFAKTISGRTIGNLMLDERGHIISANSAADNLLQQKDGIAIVRNQLHLKDGHANDKLKNHIQDAIQSQRKSEPPSVKAMSVTRPSGKPDFEILIKPLPIDKYVESAQTPHLILFINDPEKYHEIDTKVLTSLYDLTRAESLLAKHLANGKTLDQSASALGIARNTARAQLRSIFAKTGVTQQSMLVSLIWKSLVVISD